MTDWYELARRWTPRCPECGEKLDCRTVEICNNENCARGRHDMGVYDCRCSFERCTHEACVEGRFVYHPTQEEDQ